VYRRKAALSNVCSAVIVSLYQRVIVQSILDVIFAKLCTVLQTQVHVLYVKEEQGKIASLREIFLYTVSSVTFQKSVCSRIWNAKSVKMWLMLMNATLLLVALSVKVNMFAKALMKIFTIAIAMDYLLYLVQLIPKVAAG